MLLRTKTKAASAGLTVLILLVLTASTLGQSAKRSARRQLADQLKDFKHTAYAMLQEADALNSFVRRRGLQWESHTYRLNALREHVNRLGKMLSELVAQKTVETDSQSLAIEHARPHLVSVAQNLTQAITLVNENRNNINWKEYADVVGNIYAHADALHNKTDTILDYEEAAVRLNKLALRSSPMPAD